VAVRDSEKALTLPPLGKAVVEESSFAGSHERLRLRLPPLAGVRPIAPPAPFGGEYVLIEASRTQHLARQFPLAPGDTVWVGVARLHALTHPGLSLLLAADGTADSEAAFDLGTEIAALAQARVTLLACGADTAEESRLKQRARPRISGGIAAFESRSTKESSLEAIAAETLRHHYHLVIVPQPADDAPEVAARLLQAGTHNLLLVPGAAPAPKQVLICVAVGEPSKENVLFSGRLLRHLRARATLLTVLPEHPADTARRQAERFLEAAGRTLGLLGVASRPLIRSGDAHAEILDEVRRGGHGLVVMGSPLGLSVAPGSRGRIGGLLGDMLSAPLAQPLLITRSRQVASGG